MQRREFFKRAAVGMEGVAASAYLAGKLSAEENSSRSKTPLRPRPTHFPAKAKSVIFLFMAGGQSQVDTFDPKPL